MPNQTPVRSVLYSFVPIIDRKRQHVRTTLGTVIPFTVIQTTAAITAIVLGLEITFGLSNWITIPTALFTLGWTIDAVDTATAQHDHTTADDHNGTQS